jgi:hypothetical protein
MANVIHEREFELPEAGLHNAIFRDVLDLGLVVSKWEGAERTNNKHRVFFELEERDSQGGFIVLRRDYTSDLAPKALITAMVEAVLGHQLTSDERRHLDLDELIGAPVQLIVIHQQSKTDGRTYANVKEVLPWPSKLKVTQKLDPDYVRVEYRANYKPPVAPKVVQQQQPPAVKDGVTDADVPF